MGAESDQVKGKAEQAAGIVTGNEKLESQGKSDRSAGEAKEKIERAKDKVDAKVEHAKDKLDEAVDKAKHVLHRK
jgi:uncharacterized protein YjbJ (UPF0337 family)